MASQNCRFAFFSLPLLIASVAHGDQWFLNGEPLPSKKNGGTIVEVGDVVRYENQASGINQGSLSHNTRSLRFSTGWQQPKLLSARILEPVQIPFEFVTGDGNEPFISTGPDLNSYDGTPHRHPWREYVIEFEVMSVESPTSLHLGIHYSHLEAADANGDRFITGRDMLVQQIARDPLTYWQTRYGMMPMSGGADLVSVPEPSAWLLSALAVTYSRSNRRQRRADK